MKSVAQAMAVVATALALTATGASAQAADLPDGVTPDMVATGESLFKGLGLCFACHGPTGKGVPGAGVDLTDDEWLHGDPTFEALVTRILDGVGPAETQSGVIMVPKGGSQVTDEQIRAIASYVWTLAQRAQMAPAGGT